MSDLLAWRPVLTGAAVAAAIAVVVALTLRLADGNDNLGFAVFAGIMISLAIGGFLAARPQTEVAFTAGAAAAAIASVALLAVDVVVRTARGLDVGISYLVGSAFTVLLACSFGVVGGAIALWRDRNKTNKAEEAPT